MYIVNLFKEGDAIVIQLRLKISIQWDPLFPGNYHINRIIFGVLEVFSTNRFSNALRTYD